MTIKEARAEARRRGWRIETGARCCQIRRNGVCLHSEWTYPEYLGGKEHTVILLVTELLAAELEPA